jgi:hypothetical protein
MSYLLEAWSHLRRVLIDRLKEELLALGMCVKRDLSRLEVPAVSLDPRCGFAVLRPPLQFVFVITKPRSMGLLGVARAKHLGWC